jgi:transcriptional regulator with XRE-family HTH domain
MREAQGLSVRQLAQLAGVSFSHLSRVERGERVPTERWLRDVTEALGKHMAGAA